MSDPNLITSYTFQGRPFLVKMNVINGCLELILNDKQTGEGWECSYDVSYIQQLTRKTGNYKEFEIFIAMLKSGLLKTRECITLDLLSYEELEAMRIRRVRSQSSNRLISNGYNRRYLILTYTVEFDRIHYPLPLEYYGLPDPVVLQNTIRKLESELDKAHDELSLKDNYSEKKQARILQKRIEELTAENTRLNDEVKHLTTIISNNPKSQVRTFQKAITQIEKNLMYERKSHHKLLEKLQNEKLYLANQLEKLKISERSLKVKLQQVTSRDLSGSNTHKKNRHLSVSKSCEPAIHTLFERQKSPLVKSSKRVQVIQKSRSVSPRIMYEEDWQNFSENMKHRPPSNKSKSRSRSSSVSSTRKSYQQVLPNFPLSTEVTPIHSPRHSRRPSPYSGRSSVKSYNSEQPRSRLKKLQTPARSRSVSPDETQLQAQVHKMFQNRHLKQF